MNSVTHRVTPVVRHALDTIAHERARIDDEIHRLAYAIAERVNDDQDAILVTLCRRLGALARRYDALGGEVTR